MKRNRTNLVAALGIAAAAAALTVGGGSAANAADPTPTISDTSPQACWMDVVTERSLCVPLGDDLVAAVQSADGVSITAPIGTDVGGVTITAARVQASLFAAVTPQTDTIVSGIFDDVNYGGGVLYLTAPGSGCSWSLPNLGTFGWNDRASSFKSYAGCKTALYQNINFLGTHVGYATNDASFGSFNDQASSWKTE